jgi:hypothetical protein
MVYHALEETLQHTMVSAQQSAKKLTAEATDLPGAHVGGPSANGLLAARKANAPVLNTSSTCSGRPEAAALPRSRMVLSVCQRWQ